MNNFAKTTRIVVLAVLFAAVFLAGGIYVGWNHQSSIEKIVDIVNKEDAVITSETDFEPFWKAWDTINEKYPGAEGVDNQARVYGAISGLVDSLEDDYTVFFDPDETKSFEEEVGGNFTGVGMEVDMKDKVLTVIAPLKNTPAERAGIKTGDKIIKINDTETRGLTIEKAIKLIRGEKGTTVLLTIFREGEQSPREIEIVRDLITIPTLDTELRTDGIFVIKLYSFSGNVPRLFRDAMKEFTRAKTDKLLLDLRGNPGGYLSSAISVASWFLPGGKTVLIEDFGKDAEQKIYRSHGYNPFNDKLKFVILIDGGSASASEIVAGAMQDYSRAKLVGEKSFGKGSVQEVVDITPDTILKITVAKWLTPNGNSISKVGLTPDYQVAGAEEEVVGDSQLNKAVEVLLKK